MRVPQSVLIPAPLCAQIAMRIMRDHREQSARNGGGARLPDDVTQLLAELTDVAQTYVSSAVGTGIRHIASGKEDSEMPFRVVEVTPDAALRLRCSPSYLRRLCREGRVPGAQKVGHEWQIPVDFELKGTSE